MTSSGSYTLCVELTGATSNKNYSIANGKYEYAFTIGSGSIDFRDLPFYLVPAA